MEKGKTGKTITLKSNDGKEFTIPEAVALQSSMFRNMIDEDWVPFPYPLDNVAGQTLAMLIDYCGQHGKAADESETDGQGISITPASSRMSEEELTNWDKQFLDVDMGTLYDLMLAAQYLGTEGLLQLTTKRVVDLVKGKNLEEMRQIFKLKNDFTAKEEEQIHCEFRWVLTK